MAFYYTRYDFRFWKILAGYRRYLALAIPLTKRIVITRGLCIEIRSQESLSAWLARFQSIFLTGKQIHHHFRRRQIRNSDDPLRANVFLVASDQPESSSPSPQLKPEYSANSAPTPQALILRTFCASVRVLAKYSTPSQLENSCKDSRFGGASAADAHTATSLLCLGGHQR